MLPAEHMSRIAAFNSAVKELGDICEARERPRCPLSAPSGPAGPPRFWCRPCGRLAASLVASGFASSLGPTNRVPLPSAARLLHPGDGLRNDFRRDRLPRSGTAHCRVSDEQHSRLLKRGIDYMRAVEPLEAIDYAHAQQLYESGDRVPYLLFNLDKREGPSSSVPVLFSLHARPRFRWLEGERYSAVIGGFRRPLWRREPVEVTVERTHARETVSGQSGDIDAFVRSLTVYQIDMDVWAALPGLDKRELLRHWEEVWEAYCTASRAQPGALPTVR
jgi:hypothetical protein